MSTPSTSTRLLRSGGCAFAITLAIFGCSASSSPGGTPPGTPIGQPTSTMINGSTGGTATSSDGNVSVDIPAGAVAGNITITIQAETSPGGNALGTVYEIGPTGTQFSVPVTMAFKYAGLTSSSTPATSLRVATYASSAWQILSGFSEDATNVSGTTTHLSPYGIVAEASATGGTCAIVTISSDCGGTQADASVQPGGGSGGGSSSTPDAGSGPVDAGAQLRRPDDCSTPPTCETDPSGVASACSGYPGSTSSCTDNSGGGYTVSCCFPTGAPVCLQSSSGTETGGGGSSGGNSGADSSTPIATLDASASPGFRPYDSSQCSDLPGSTAGSSNDCCFAPGAPVCVTYGEEDACTGTPTEGSGSSGGTGSSGGSSCSGGPTCEDTANPCGGLEGTTMLANSCTDQSNGFVATCCYPVGTLPSSGSNSGGGVTTGGEDAGSSPADASVHSGGGSSGGSSGSSSGAGSSGSSSGGAPPSDDAGI